MLETKNQEEAKEYFQALVNELAISVLMAMLVSKQLFEKKKSKIYLRLTTTVIATLLFLTACEAEIPGGTVTFTPDIEEITPTPAENQEAEPITIYDDVIQRHIDNLLSQEGIDYSRYFSLIASRDHFIQEIIDDEDWEAFELQYERFVAADQIKMYLREYAFFLRNGQNSLLGEYINEEEDESDSDTVGLHVHTLLNKIGEFDRIDPTNYYTDLGRALRSMVLVAESELGIDASDQDVYLQLRTVGEDTKLMILIGDQHVTLAHFIYNQMRAEQLVLTEEAIYHGLGLTAEEVQELIRALDDSMYDVTVVTAVYQDTPLLPFPEWQESDSTSENE
jgi:hypothetical protein